MKNTVTYLVLLLALGATRCSKTISPDDSYTSDLSQAKTWFDGNWNLVSVDVPSSNAIVPNVQLVVSKNQITVIENGKQIDRVNFEIIKSAYNLQLKTNAQPRSDNWYVRDPALRISNNQMYLDAGTANDGPGFRFKRIQ